MCKGGFACLVSAGGTAPGRDAARHTNASLEQRHKHKQHRARSSFAEDDGQIYLFNWIFLGQISYKNNQVYILPRRSRLSGEQTRGLM